MLGHRKIEITTHTIYVSTEEHYLGDDSLATLDTHPISLKDMYAGCFQDSVTDRDLHDFVWRSKTMSVVKCILHCAGHQFTYSAVQVNYFHYSNFMIISYERNLKIY